MSDKGTSHRPSVSLLALFTGGPAPSLVTLTRGAVRPTGGRERSERPTGGRTRGAGEGPVPGVSGERRKAPRVWWGKGQGNRGPCGGVKSEQGEG